MKKQINICEVCGALSENKEVYFRSIADKFLCNKHYQQFKRYKKFLDNTSRTIDDLNEITIDVENNIAYIHLYNAQSVEIAKTIIDLEDVEKIKNIKWRPVPKRNKLYVKMGKGYCQEYLSRFLLNYKGELEVDHIDGNELNNSKSNLRIVERKFNTFNLAPKNISTTHIRGVSYSNKEKRYIIDFTCDKKRLYFKHFKTINEAVYIRYLCEITFQKEFRYFSNDENINNYINELSEVQKQELSIYFYNKIQEKLNAS